ncbi:hypothetical protein SAMN05216598_5668 [Pseudomonas asplenii]|uniref:Uncharacterized protein n=1 Tax=Pseudomonas asplenii TaxID=53407 RepID=A0A1H2AA89_9PSED|nr:hypothetical protein SAMN05216598_5668 [Pseudomonas asplenii]SEI14767.1 hypothetical protein SAMN05216581_2831 [Pseudomonas fuscovaginae]
MANQALFPALSLGFVLRLTALCELSVNIGSGDEWLLSFPARFRPHVTCARYSHEPAQCSESPVGRPRVLMNCVGQGRLFAVVPLPGRFWRRSRL